MLQQELEESLARLESVDAVRVVGSAEKVTEVHVLSAPGRAAKQVVRDVQSLAMAQFGANLDRRVISVVQIAPEKVRHDTTERPVIVSIREAPEGASSTAEVTLGWQTGEHTGSATGPAASSARLRLIGEATLQALDDMFQDVPPMSLDTIGVATVGLRDVMLAVVLSGQDRREAVSIGAALVAGDQSDAAVRAVMDAINRKLPNLGRD
ncbi:MAG: hypothetical protein HKO87_06405 [Acidimicrobiia bacterium]|nr:hypothetical protein [Acidimicrobiia bacterium]NNK92047.1 hypothetical protein [Acidimicrobiia bacterium]